MFYRWVVSSEPGAQAPLRRLYTNSTQSPRWWRRRWLWRPTNNITISIQHNTPVNKSIVSLTPPPPPPPLRRLYTSSTQGPKWWGHRWLWPPINNITISTLHSTPVNRSIVSHPTSPPTPSSVYQQYPGSKMTATPMAVAANKQHHYQHPTQHPSQQEYSKSPHLPPHPLVCIPAVPRVQDDGDTDGCGSQQSTPPPTNNVTISNPHSIPVNRSIVSPPPSHSPHSIRKWKLRDNTKTPTKTFKSEEIGLSYFTTHHTFLCPRIEWSGAYCFVLSVCLFVCLFVCLSVCCQL